GGARAVRRWVISTRAAPAVLAAGSGRGGKFRRDRRAARSAPAGRRRTHRPSAPRLAYRDARPRAPPPAARIDGALRRAGHLDLYRRVAHPALDATARHRRG